jgi:acetyl esterase/lipase
LIDYDPELRLYAEQFPTFDLGNIATARGEMEALSSGFAPTRELTGVQWSDRTVDGALGTSGVRIRVYEPDQTTTTPTAGVLFLHGGGFVFGSVETEHFAAGRLAAALGIVVVSVDYRLAPEHPFPAGLEDCYAALQWFHDEAANLQVDQGRIAVVGNSAGGCLAAALAILARDRSGPALCFQYLGVPALDDRLTTASMQTYIDTPLWNRPAAALSWQYYLGDLHAADEVPITAAPGRATASQLAGLPPAYISAMQHDPLRDEAINYGIALLEVGVSVELHTFPGTFHGSSQIPGAAVSKRDRREMAACLQAALRLPSS